MGKKKADLTNLKKTIDNLTPDKKEIGDKLLNRLEFMDKTLDVLEADIKEKGPVIEGTNGNGFNVVNENPAQKSYNITIGKYNALIKTIDDLISSNSTQKSDELMDFLGGG